MFDLVASASWLPSWLPVNMVPWLVLLVFLFSFAYIRFQWGARIKNQFAALSAINQPALKWIAWLSILDLLHNRLFLVQDGNANLGSMDL